MSLMGSLLKGAGKVAGKGLEIGIKATGEIGGAIAEYKGDYKLAKNIRSNSKVIAEGTYEVAKVGGEYLGKGVDKAIEVGAKTGASVGEYIANENGFDVDKSRKIGAAVGGGAVGMLAGEVVGGTLTAVTALTGTASTGTAISALHGAAQTNATLAVLGGGSLAAGGAGVAGGHAVLTAIDTISTVSAGASAVKNEAKSNRSQNLTSSVTDVIDCDFIVSEDK